MLIEVSKLFKCNFNHPYIMYLLRNGMRFIPIESNREIKKTDKFTISIENTLFPKYFVISTVIKRKFITKICIRYIPKAQSEISENIFLKTTFFVLQ